MKLLICVINSDDRYPLLDALIERGHSATVLSTIGGFLREGNTTLLIGTPDQKIHDVLRIIRARCATRTKLVYPFPAAAGEETYMSTPVEVEVGGAPEQALEIDPTDAGVQYNVACLYSLEAQPDRAIQCLEGAVDAGFGHRDWIEHDPDLDSLREHPRFQDLLGRI